MTLSLFLDAGSNFFASGNDSHKRHGQQYATAAVSAASGEAVHGSVVGWWLRAPLVLFSQFPFHLRRECLLDVELPSYFVGSFVCPGETHRRVDNAGGLWKPVATRGGGFSLSCMAVVVCFLRGRGGKRWGARWILAIPIRAHPLIKLRPCEVPSPTSALWKKHAG